jgi:hypothetical protein
MFFFVTIFFPFSKQKNFLLVGTADGNLAIFEDKMVKVNVKYILIKFYFKSFVLYISSLFYVINKLPDNTYHKLCFLSFYCFIKYMSLENICW